MEKEKNNYYGVSDRPSVRPSTLFHSLLEVVKEQIEYESFGREQISRMGQRRIVTDRMVMNICVVIAEIYALDPAREMIIDGSMMPVSFVQGVYQELTSEHIEFVIENLKQVSETIQKKKAYIRTALYNSVSEINLHYQSLVRHDFGYQGGRST